MPRERRHTRDRRSEPSATRRAPLPGPWARLASGIGRDIAIVVGAVITIIFAVRYSRPVFTNQPPVVQNVARRAPTVAQTVLDTTPRGRLVGTPQFERDRRAFAEALVRTKRLSPARADSIAYYAVREAYVNGIPPAVVFGVMLTENAKFESSAKSNVGAVGLMQVYPKIWLKALRDRFGHDIAVDSTNIKYGTFILNEFIKSESGAVSPQELRRGLLRYNGCVRGTNTPNCRTYPDKVQRFVETLGRPLCGDQPDFDECIARPFLAGLRGRPEEAAAAD